MRFSFLKVASCGSAHSRERQDRAGPGKDWQAAPQQSLKILHHLLLLPCSVASPISPLAPITKQHQTSKHARCARMPSATHLRLQLLYLCCERLDLVLLACCLVVLLLHTTHTGPGTLHVTRQTLLQPPAPARPAKAADLLPWRCGHDAGDRDFGSLAMWHGQLRRATTAISLLKHSLRFDNIQDQSWENPYCASAVGRWLPVTQYTLLSPSATHFPLGNRGTVVQLSLPSAHLNSYVC